jgi:hypothetical protein
MLATLCSHENRFGPYHPQTMILMARLGVAYWQAGQFNHAEERSIRDLGGNVGRDCNARLQAMAALENLYAADCDFERAEAIQRELRASVGMETNKEGVNCEYSPLGKFIFRS